MIPELAKEIVRKSKLDFFDKTLIMQWYNISDKERVNFENVIMTTLGK